MRQNDPVQIAPICANRTSAGNVLIPARWEIENHTRAISLYFVWYNFIKFQNMPLWPPTLLNRH
jgi:hypothetical protein